MKKEICISIKPIVKMNYFSVWDKDNLTTKCTKMYLGSVWGETIRFSKYCFDLLDGNGSIVYTGSISDLHARTASDRTFPDDPYMTEFTYTPVDVHTLV